MNVNLYTSIGFSDSDFNLPTKKNCKGCFEYKTCARKNNPDQKGYCYKSFKPTNFGKRSKKK